MLTAGIQINYFNENPELKDATRNAAGLKTRDLENLQENTFNIEFGKDFVKIWSIPIFKIKHREKMTNKGSTWVTKKNMNMM